MSLFSCTSWAAGAAFSLWRFQSSPGGGRLAPGGAGRLGEELRGGAGLSGGTDAGAGESLRRRSGFSKATTGRGRLAGDGWFDAKE